MTPLTRGPLPARVYWTRRLLILGTAALLVVGIARLLGGGSDASSQPEATQVAMQSTPSTTPTRTVVATKKPHAARTTQAPVLAAPDGSCTDEDISATPVVRQPIAGSDVVIVVKLHTLTAAACTWRVSPASLTLKITSGQDDIWTTRQCPRSVPTKDVVLRQAVMTTVGVTWSSRRSDQGCTTRTGWALPGWYHIAAAALAGEPSDVQFKLKAPTSQVVTTTVTPSPHPQHHKSGGRPVASPVASPSG